MAQQEIPKSPKYRYSYYTQLKGIDMTCDPTQVPRYRAADLLNVVPDPATSNPRKRVGWRKLYSFGVNETFLGSRHIVDWGVDIIVTSAAVYWHGSNEATWTNNNVHTLISNSNNVDSGVGFVGFDVDRDYRLNVYGKRYIVTKSGSTITASLITGGYVPITVISRNPDGTDGYAYEAVNAFTRERDIYFLGDEESTNFYFYPSSDRDNHYVVDVSAVYKRNASTGAWDSISFTKIATGSTVKAYTSQDKTSTSYYSTYTGFSVSIPAPPGVVGQDNIKATIVEFPVDEDSTGTCYGYWDPIVAGIMESNVCARYGLKSMDREFFAAGNRRIYYTDPDNYDYLPDNNYLEVEVDSPVVGFHRKNNCLVAITQDSAEYTVFMITGDVGAITHSVLNEAGIREDSTEEMTYFTARTAIAGTGAISRRSFSTLVDDALFLSRHGIYGITSNMTTSETVLANRSELINPRLEEEGHPEKAVSAIWNGMYLLALNDHVYLLDSHVTHKNIGVSYGYECYYWEDVPITDALSYEGALFFGDHSGGWCRLNTDIKNVTAYEDGGTLDEFGNISGGTAIHAMYALRLDSDDAPQYFKILNKRGSAFEMMQLAGSGVKLSYSKDGGTPILINNLKLSSKFTWTLVDFENFSFSGAGIVRTYYPKKKVKKYKYLQFIFESDEKDQDFGICGFTKTYYFGNFAKG